MIVFRTTGSDGDEIRINFCDSGLYIQLGNDNGDIFEMRSSIIEDQDEIDDLIDYLNRYKDSLKKAKF